MKIDIKKQHKSINSGLAFELPMFTVLTGVNGSGKTHLLEAIYDRNKSDILLEGKHIQNIRYVPYNGFTPVFGKYSDSITVDKRVDDIWNELSSIQNTIINTDDFIDFSNIENDPIFSIFSKSYYKIIITDISKKLRIHPSKLNRNHIYDSINFNNGDLFSNDFSLVFKAYHVKKIDNLLNKFYLENGEKDIPPYLNDDIFEKRHGSNPWDFVNSLFERLSLPYIVNHPEGLRRQSPFELKIRHKINGNSVDGNDFSTGEKVLLSLVLAVYKSTIDDGLPEMLILDEPDAPLHPSMSKIMLEILEEDIVKKLKIPVLISTHSPATIACAPASSIYKIDATTKIPEQCDLESSMQILSGGIPNFRVSMENRRQVFVEHTYDAEYYESLFNIISRIHLFTIVPQFLPPHNREGSNRDDVLKITSMLRDMGNSYVYGLIDGDLKNVAEDRIVILGFGKRYSIENYIFEPHFLGLYLVYKNFISPSDIGLKECHSYLDVCNLVKNNNDKLQIIVEAIEDKILFDCSDKSKETSTLIGGYSISVRKKLFTMNGHDLEKRYKEIWPNLKSVRSNNKGDSFLKKDIIDTVIKDSPLLISKDIEETFLELK